MQELIDRLESAAGPNLALEWEIHLAVRGIEGAGMYGRHPNYTASLDTALTLVPEGWSWRVSVSENRRHPAAVLGRSHPTNRTIYQEARSTPAIAVCIAALKARSA